MKKIILFLLVLFSLNIKVQASTKDVYYSEYSNFSEFTEVKIDGSELIDVESERRYRWYKENITNEYLLYDEGINKYEHVDLELFKESEYSDWQDELPISITGRIIQEKLEYKVQKLKPIQSLFIHGFSFTKDKVNLGVEIYVNNRKIDYQSICGGCNEENLFSSNGFLMIDFYEPYYMKDITIKIIGDEQEYIDSFKILAVEPEIAVDVPSNIFAISDYQNTKVDDIVINDDDFRISNPKYEEEIIYNELPDISNLDYMEIDTKYRYQDKYYYFYNVEQEYIDGYYGEYPGYIKDENNYKDYYRYRTREKIVIENEMTITRYRESLDDFIESTVDYKLESNINYLENGVYSVRYITPFKTITREVTVDIEENDLREELETINQKYDNLISEYDDSRKQIKELTNNIDVNKQVIRELEYFNNSTKEQLYSNIAKYQELLSDYNLLKNEYQNINDKDIDLLKDENEKCSNDLLNIKLKNDDNEKKLKLSNQANNYLEQILLNIEQESVAKDKINIIPFILVGLIILLLVIIIIKNMSSEN